MKIIDLETFPRRSHYELFKSYAYPYMGITANVDVTNLYNAAKDLGGSPFLAFLWTAANAANAIPEMRQRIVNIQANHALVDGLHVGQFFQKFQTLADSV